MPVTPTIQNTFPTVGASADTWGATLNARGGETYVDIQALAAQGNDIEDLADGALQRTGGAMSGDIFLADGAQGSARSAGFRGVPVTNSDQDRTFDATDAGEMTRFFGTTARTWTIPNTSTVSYQIGTTIVVRSFSSASLSIVRAAGVSLRVPGSISDANRTLAAFGLATLIMEDNNLWLLSGTGVA